MKHIASDRVKSNQPNNMCMLWILLKWACLSWLCLCVWLNFFTRYSEHQCINEILAIVRSGRIIISRSILFGESSSISPLVDPSIFSAMSASLWPSPRSELFQRLQQLIVVVLLLTLVLLAFIGVTIWACGVEDWCWLVLLTYVYVVDWYCCCYSIVVSLFVAIS